MYKVKLKLSSPGYRNFFMNCIFVPKASSRQKIDVMKEKVIRHTMDKLKEVDSTYSKFSCEVVEFKNLKTDFVFNENYTTEE